MQEEQALMMKIKQVIIVVLLAIAWLGSARKKSLQQSKSSPTNFCSGTPVFASMASDSTVSDKSEINLSSSIRNKLLKKSQDKANEHMTRHTIPHLTPFARSRFFLSHFVLDVGDSYFNYLMDDDQTGSNDNNMNGLGISSRFGIPMQQVGNSHSARLLTDGHGYNDHGGHKNSAGGGGGGGGGHH